MKIRKMSGYRPGYSRAFSLALMLAGSTVLTGCLNDDDSSPSSSGSVSLDTNLFPEDGQLEATIRRTTDGVPHITADNLKSAAFGHGYAQAQDNVCMLAEAIVKARSERAKYFGPGPDDINIINDFSFKAQKILSGAEEEFPMLSPESTALIEGFAAGYNKYVSETAPGDLPAECNNQPWVKTITPVDLFAHYRIVGQYASGALFATGAVFLAVPPGESPVPESVVAASQSMDPFKLVAANARMHASDIKNFQDMGLASNAWGIGREMSEGGKGALLANPHFPYTGHRRLYQVQMTVPGYLNAMGAGLLGTAVPLINFNENLGWSHTVTTSRRFTLYELTLKDGDNLTYIKDGVEKPITSETFQVEVFNGSPTPTVLERTFYYSEYGPMLSANAVTSGGLPKWGANGTAYTYRDANASTTRLLDTWLQMSQASNLQEFQDVFRNCGTTFWTNSTYADDQGNAFYIDSSSVPNLSKQALAVIAFKRNASAAYNQLFNAGLTLLDGNSSRDDWVEGSCNGLVPYEDKPKLLRADWVQNSNDSYWSTNPAEFLTGYSPMFGPEESPLGPRTRLGISMLQNPLSSGPVSPTAPEPAGQDGKFGAEDLVNVIYNNRAWYADEFLDELRNRCTAIGATQVLLPTAGSRSVDQGCAVLQAWDGLYNIDSVGAHVYRVFIANYRNSFATDLTVPFDPTDPVATPSTPSATNAGTPDDPMLQALAVGLNALDSVGIAYDAALGTVQYYQPSGGALPGLAGGSLSGGTPTDLGPSFPWHGGDGGVDGAFNAIGVVTDPFLEDTRFPRVAPSTIANTAGLSDVAGEGWRMARGTSWHFGLEFTDNGPEAFGLVSYSQSTDSDSTFFNDQSQRFSDKNYRPIAFSEEDIEASLLTGGEQTITSD
ncbi:penicillin acylase family protein [Marinobacter salinexigens]|uniref:Penicillin acylase family protein n=1 Tax=Marinobacter salinexigens TaxID=2919747 RepID=A0A5B0VB93_9GAMM|nr:penicillin acylase family protein [Marinobacter salinexigens]KAA1171321.1 penicillin acylase family protein [Marinobacter salinexigens]